MSGGHKHTFIAERVDAILALPTNLPVQQAFIGVPVC
jgi:hypothetical protein